MMYHNKLAVAIKSNGKVLREKGETVYLPFGTEYSIFIKNLNNARVRLSITIDGQDVTGGGLIVNANSVSDLQRSIANGNMSSGNAFKFIERSEQITQHRGNRVDDGIVRIEYEFERQPVNYIQSTPAHRGWDPQWGWNDPRFGTIMNASATDARAIGSTDHGGIALCSAQGATGITVPGSVVDQRFVTASAFFGDGQTNVIVLMLKGETETGAPLQKAIDVKHKIECGTCGHKSKPTVKFCPNCGTSLVIV